MERIGSESSTDDENIQQLYTKGVLESLQILDPNSERQQEEIIKLIPLIEYENKKEEKKQKSPKKKKENKVEENRRLSLLLKKGIEGTIYSNIFNILSVLPSTATIGKLGLGYPFISTLSHYASVSISNEFFCKSTLKELGFSKKISKLICLLIEYFVYYYILLGTTNMVFMYLLAPTPTTMEFFIKYSTNLRDLFISLSKTFRSCTNDAIEEILKFQGKGVGYEIQLVKKAMSDLNKLNEKYFVKLIDQANNYSISFATNIGLLGYSNDLNIYLTKTIKTTKSLAEKTKKSMPLLSDTFASIASYFVDTGIAENVIFNKTEFMKNITENPFQRNSTSGSVANVIANKDLNILFKELEKTKGFSETEKYEFELEEFAKIFQELMIPSKNHSTIWDLIFINSKKISQTNFDDLNKRILNTTLQGAIDLIENLQNSELDTIREFSRTKSLSQCSNFIFYDLIQFNNKIQIEVEKYDESMDINPNNDLFGFMNKYDIHIPNIFATQNKNESDLVSFGQLSGKEKEIKKDINYIALGSFNIASLIMVFILLFLTITKILLFVKKVMKR